jgi:glucose-6-phosphate 1-dehydrogenase
VRFDGAALRDETVKVLRSIRPLDVAQEAVRGQYGPGTLNGEGVPGYRQETGVAADSATTTFVALKFVLNNWRWAGVPFYLRTGKRMAKKLTEVAIQFKPTPHLMFPVNMAKLHQNQLTFRLQPHEGIIQTFAAKRPGPELTICPVRMNFLYTDTFALKAAPRAYAWLLRDVMQGDQTLFARSDWIDAAWSIVDPIVQYWEAHPPTGFPNYAAGTWGPAASDQLFGPNGRHWDEI